MKKFATLTVIFALLLTMTACTSREDNSSSSSSSSEPSMPPPETSSSSMPSSEPSSSSPASSLPAMSTDFAQIGTLSKDSVLWGPGTHKDDKNRPTDVLPLQEKYGQYNAHFIAPDSEKIYLTFDEGYENGYTSKILDALKEKNAPAVFFVTLPYVKQNPDLIKRMIDEGHIVGNHSTKHPNYTTLPIEEAYEDALELHEYMIENFDYNMTLFRFPEGAFSEQTVALLQSMNYKTIFWSFAYADWDPNKQLDPVTAMDKIVSNLHGGEIALLHAVSKTNADILPELIDTIRAKGFVISPYDVEYN